MATNSMPTQPHGASLHASSAPLSWLTRMMMGLVLPPRVAPSQIVIVPVTPKEDSRDAIIDACHALAEILRRDCRYADQPLRVHVDGRDLGGGVKKVGMG